MPRRFQARTLPAALVIALLQAGLVYQLSPAAANVFFVIAFAWSWVVLDELRVRKRRREGRWP